MSAGKILVGVIAGMAAGAALGVLFAPEKGSDTRSKISRKGADAYDGLKDKLDDMIALLLSKFDDTKKDLSNFVEKEKYKSEAT